jgi:hypothetical protein
VKKYHVKGSGKQSRRLNRNREGKGTQRSERDIEETGKDSGGKCKDER